MILLFLNNGCVYYPQLNDIPLIKEKNDLRIDAGFSSMFSAYSTISYGLTDKIAVQVYGNYLHGYHFHGALGYYKNFKEKNVFEAYSGLGYGNGEAYKDANPGHLTGDYYLPFAQLNYGRVNCRFAHLDYGIGLKTGYMTSNFLDKNFYEPNESLPYISYKDNSILLEPTLFMRLGGYRLKFDIKIGSCYIYKLTNVDRNLPYSHLNFGIGLNYRLK